ncbi:MAG: preprotein translocase subunit SecA [Clostridia bacterium]|nr:preprotein translocase subunit SecA [Clostridia bacterium]
MKKFFEKILGSYSDREIKRLMPIVEEIESYQEKMASLTDHELKNYTNQFKEMLKDGKTMDDILPEAFAVVREASKRVLNMTHYRVQLIGGIVLHQGRIAEMKTGEGKTLVATLPVYLNALTGEGVHVITVNDYLAKRDSEWMGKVYSFLGLSVGLIIHDMEPADRKKAYDSDITYGTNNEFGFDYLRDNMVIYKERMAQRGHTFAIVDEVDSILVDEARTPLIISGPGEKSTDLYKVANSFALRLKKQVFAELNDKESNEDVDADYIIDEKASTATLTKSGVEKAERAFNVENLTDPENMTLLHHINQALRAIGIMKKDKDYVIKDNEIIIVDEFTGRMMYGRRYSNGLHQAIEAKEGVKVERESKTLATITFQNYFRMYKKLSGMTGTALTEEEEFREIYSLDVIEIPTNREVIRVDQSDVIYKTEKAKFDAVINEIVERNQKNQPMLVGTISIEKSEHLSMMLRKRGIKHEVLNAKQHHREAEIVAQAGKPGAITIATNMAGRGTDIVLGGNAEHMATSQMRKEGFSEELIIRSTGFDETADEEVIAARERYSQLYNEYKKELGPARDEVIASGGLYIIGTERHESRRIDNQLRGRSGRQGDPGESRFFIALEDDLMRLFGQDRLTNIVTALRLPDDVPIEHKLLSNAIESAQKKVEGNNFNIRKHVLQYDDVMNQQRDVIYKQRKKVLDGESMKDIYLNMLNSTIERNIGLYCIEEDDSRKWDWFGILASINSLLAYGDPIDIKEDERAGLRAEDLIEKLKETAIDKYNQKEEEVTEKTMREAERIVLLRVVDSKWMDHIDAMDQLRQGIGLRAYGQRDPVVEYKFEGFSMFEEMNHTIQEQAVKMIMSIKTENKDALKQESRPIITNNMKGGSIRKTASKKVGRNDPCPCGSGKKYKNCHGGNQ